MGTKREGLCPLCKVSGRPWLKVQEHWVTQHRQNEHHLSLLQSVTLSVPWRDGLLSFRDMTSQIPPVFIFPPGSELTPVLTTRAFPPLCIQTCNFAVWSGRPTPQAALASAPSLLPTCRCAQFCFSLCFGDCLLSQLLCPLKHFPLLTLLTSVSPKFPSLLFIFTPHGLLDPCLLSAGTSSFIASSSSWCKRMRGKTTKAVFFRKYQRTSSFLSFWLDSFLSF